jgi:hypothetical protein
VCLHTPAYSLYIAPEMSELITDKLTTQMLSIKYPIGTHTYGFVILRFFFFGEGPRSRCYGRTAALRLLEQPCDEDEMISFFISTSNGAPVQ